MHLPDVCLLPPPQETIDVSGGESSTFEVATTRHGPVVEGDPRGAGLGLAAAMTGIDPAGTKWMDSVRSHHSHTRLKIAVFFHTVSR